MFSNQLDSENIESLIKDRFLIARKLKYDENLEVLQTIIVRELFSN